MLRLLEGFEAIVGVVEEGVYGAAKREALSRISSRDGDDWPILAAALVLDLPIWTEDQDFVGAGVPTWTTDRVELSLKAKRT